MAAKLAHLHDEAPRRGEPIPVCLPGATPVFRAPAAPVRTMDRDLVAAGIANMVVHEDRKRRIDKREEWGRGLDVHALGTTFGTLLAKGGVCLRTSREAMWPSDPRLTANV